MTRLPDFILIGAMKCGTTTLHEQLAAQDGFFMSTPKEPNFFSDDNVFANGIAWYRDLFRLAPAGTLAGESSTHYTKLPTHPNTLARLRPVLPHARFVYVMRHPVDRLISHYIHEWTQGVIRQPISEALDEHPELIDYGRYAYQLRPWIDAFGRDRILPVFFERMTAAPEAELSRIAAFLGARAAVTWREEQAATNVSAERIRKFPLYDLLVDNPVATRLRRALVPRSLRDRIKANRQMRERPTLSAAADARVRAVFDQDLGQLSTLIEADLACATFKQTVAAAPIGWR